MLTYIFLCSVGFIAGIINSIAGGGGILIFPAFLAMGLPAIVANATSSLVVWPGALTSAFGYRRQLKRIPKYYALLLIPCVVGAVIGSLTLIHTSNTFFEKLTPWLVLSAVLLLSLQSLIHRRIEHRVGKVFMSHPLRVLAIISFLIFPLAIYGGYFGVGFGIMMLALLGFTNLKNIHQMNGVKNLSGATIAIVSTVYFSTAGLINWRFGIVMFLGNALGGITGARLAQKISARIVHNTTIIVGFAITLMLLVKAYR